ncbi:MAG TPA: hypothetical protein GX520_02080 [Syntrophaceticus sp.]|nr:hypothetical protein [Syntrophaceticus sp.]
MIKEQNGQQYIKKYKNNQADNRNDFHPTPGKIKAGANPKAVLNNG